MKTRKPAVVGRPSLLRLLWGVLAFFVFGECAEPALAQCIPDTGELTFESPGGDIGPDICYTIYVNHIQIPLTPPGHEINVFQDFHVIDNSICCANLLCDFNQNCYTNKYFFSSSLLGSHCIPLKRQTIGAESHTWVIPFGTDTSTGVGRTKWICDPQTITVTWGAFDPAISIDAPATVTPGENFMVTEQRRSTGIHDNSYCEFPRSSFNYVGAAGWWEAQCTPHDHSCSDGLVLEVSSDGINWTTAAGGFGGQVPTTGDEHWLTGSTQLSTKICESAYGSGFTPGIWYFRAKGTVPLLDALPWYYSNIVTVNITDGDPPPAYTFIVPAIVQPGASFDISGLWIVPSDLTYAMIEESVDFGVTWYELCRSYDTASPLVCTTATCKSGQVQFRLGGVDGCGVTHYSEVSTTTVAAPDLITDTDGDGLPDFWETCGIPYTKLDNTTGFYQLWGAGPRHKDLFVEVDAMEGFGLSWGAIFLLWDAFDNAPLSNPDGTTGIRLNAWPDETDLFHFSPLATSYDDCWPDLFFWYRNEAANNDGSRLGYFGAPWERTDPNHAALLEAKGKAYRYCLVADLSEDNWGGCGTMPGADFVIYLGNTPRDTPENEAGKFMHELGHNLGLDHGGDQETNGKPNYPSIMNYALGHKWNWNKNFWRLDYSRAGPAELGNLNESSLNEVAGIGTVDGEYSEFMMPFGVNAFVDTHGKMIRGFRFAKLDGTYTEFGDNYGTEFQDDIPETSVVQDLNYLMDPPIYIDLPTEKSPGEILTAYNDWAHIKMRVEHTVPSKNPSDKSEGRIPKHELTMDAIDWIEQNFPIPPSNCFGDLDNSGEVDGGDIGLVLLDFGPCPGCATDLDGSGEIDGGDIGLVLLSFGPCQ